MNLAALATFPILQTARLTLRAYKLSDAPYLLEMRSDPRSMEFMDSAPLKDLAAAEEFTLEKIDDHTKQKGISWVINLKNSEKFIGDIAYWKIKTKDHRAEIGYSLLPAYWGNGYATEALEAILKWGFHQLKLHSVNADINPSNKASRRLLQKMGFKQEGYNKEDYFHNGKFLDSELYGLLEPEFINRNSQSASQCDPQHTSYMERCITLAKIAGENKEPPVGSILVSGNKIIGEGIEKVKASKDVTGHAELLAIKDAIARGHLEQLSTATMYTTHEPCLMCSYAIRTHKIPKIIYGLTVPHIGAASSTFRVLQSRAR